MNAPVSPLELKSIPDDPPPGFKRIDFQRGATAINFNTHVGPLYYKRGEKGSRGWKSSGPFLTCNTTLSRNFPSSGTNSL